MSVTWYSVIKLFEGKFRIKRLKQFYETYPDLPQLSVLDVGGSPVIWDLLKEELEVAPKHVVILNKEERELYGNYECHTGDARQLPYADNSFDLVFSNSVIEHVGNAEDKLKFAKECVRVGKEIYIQTPNRWFPIEPHIFAFFIHWLPKPLYKKLSFLSILSILGAFNMTTETKASEWINDIDLLSKKQLQQIFPQQNLLKEKAFLLVKSFVVTSRK